MYNFGSSYTNADAKNIAKYVEGVSKQNAGNPALLGRLLGEALPLADDTEATPANATQNRADVVAKIIEITQDFVPDNVANKAIASGGNDLAAIDAQIATQNVGAPEKTQAQQLARGKVADSHLNNWLNGNQDFATFLNTTRIGNAAQYDSTVEAAMLAKKDALVQKKVAEYEQKLKAGAMTRAQLQAETTNAALNPELRDKLKTLLNPEETPELETGSPYHVAYQNIRAGIDADPTIVDAYGNVDRTKLDAVIDAQLNALNIMGTAVTPDTLKRDVLKNDYANKLSRQKVQESDDKVALKNAEGEKNRAKNKLWIEGQVKKLKIGANVALLLGGVAAFTAVGGLAGGTLAGGNMLGMAAGGVIGGLAFAVPNGYKMWKKDLWSNKNLEDATKKIKQANDVIIQKQQALKNAKGLNAEQLAISLAVEAGIAAGLTPEKALEGFFKNEKEIQDRKAAAKYAQQLAGITI